MKFMQEAGALPRGCCHTAVQETLHVVSRAPHGYGNGAAAEMLAR